MTEKNNKNDSGNILNGASVQLNTTATTQLQQQKQYKEQNGTEEEKHHLDQVELIEPSTGKLFFEQRSELVFCKPHLMPLKSRALERLEEMQRETAYQLYQKRIKKNKN